MALSHQVCCRELQANNTPARSSLLSTQMLVWATADCPTLSGQSPLCAFGLRAERHAPAYLNLFMLVTAIQAGSRRVCYFEIVSILVFILATRNCFGGFWRKSPRPTFPREALRDSVEGRVVIHLSLAKDGSVTSAAILNSSGNAQLDAVAREKLLQWRARPDQLTPEILAKGRVEIVDFRQEPFRASVYPDRWGWFETEKSMRYWMFAPFPSYPVDERYRHHTGTVMIQLRIGKGGIPEDIAVVASSGYPALDQAALNAVKLWRAHKEFVGRKMKFPIKFQMRR